MNMHHVQTDEAWKTAPKNCRSEFIEMMRGKEFGAAETLEAWHWFAAGWLLCARQVGK